MISLMFTIYDSKMETYSPPFFQVKTAQAVRTFQDLAVDKETWIGRHPADFTLFEIGLFNDATGHVQINEAKINLGTALEHVSLQRGIETVERSPGFERGVQPSSMADVTLENGGIEKEAV